MKLNSREQAWQRRNEGRLKKESHPTYKKMQTKEIFEERLKNFKSIDVWSEKHIAEREEFYKKFGRAWWIFCSVPVVEKYQDQWINQFRVLDGELNE